MMLEPEARRIMTSADSAGGGKPSSEDLRPMTEEQASRLKLLAEQAFELEAFKPTLDRGEAARRIAALQAKLRLQDGPPHTL
jgi:Protein of unknown function (DUF3072)